VIIDIHTHLIRGPGDIGARADRLMRFADKFEIDKICLSLGLSLNERPSPEDFRNDNDVVLRARDRYPDRIIGFCYLNPVHEDECQEEITRCVVNNGMSGIKLWIACFCNEPCVFPIVDRAMELNVPILQHTWLKATGNRPWESTPGHMVELAARYPEAKLIMGHVGGDWEYGIKAAIPHRNLVVDIGGGAPEAGIVDMAVRYLGAERIVYGSDAGGRSYASQIAKVYGADLTASQRALILGGNAERILAS